MIWVLDDPRAGIATQAIGIAERLGHPFRRIPLTWNWKSHVAGLVPHGSLMGVASETGLETRDREAPALVISAGRRSAPVALWLRAKYGARLVHCMSPGLSGLFRREAFDLLVIPAHDRPPIAPNVMSVLGAPHRVSPLALTQAELAWQERLAHLPQPRVALLVGGPVRSVGMPPVLAHRLGRAVAQLAMNMGGTVMATTSRRTGDEAADALAAGLGPGHACAVSLGRAGREPVYGVSRQRRRDRGHRRFGHDDVGGLRHRPAGVYRTAGARRTASSHALIDSLVQAGQVRPFLHSLAPWPRTPLDEAGRVADEIRRRFVLD